MKQEVVVPWLYIAQYSSSFPKKVNTHCATYWQQEAKLSWQRSFNSPDIFMVWTTPEPDSRIPPGYWTACHNVHNTFISKFHDNVYEGARAHSTLLAVEPLYPTQWTFKCPIFWLRMPLLITLMTSNVCYLIPGVSQSQNEANGKLGTVQTVGNLWRIRLNAAKQTGTWKININTKEPYTLKITGQKLSQKLCLFVHALKLQIKGVVHLVGK